MVGFRDGTSGPYALAEFAGSYSSDEVGVTYEITVEDRWLWVELGYWMKFLIAPVSADRFVSGLGTFSFERDGRGVVTGFEVDAGRVLNLKFQRN